METDVTETVGFQKLRELLSDIVRFDEIADLIDADIAKVFFVVRPSAEPSVVVLLSFDGKQTVLDKLNERKGSHTGFGFGRICRNNNVFAVEVDGCDGVFDDDGIIFKINRIPFQTDNLYCVADRRNTEQDRQFCFVPLETSKAGSLLVSIKEAADEMIFLGTFYLSAIGRNRI